MGGVLCGGDEVKSVTALRRENTDLRKRIVFAKRVVHQAHLNYWNVDLSRVRDEVNTAKRLGYAVEIHFDGDKLVTTAVKRQDA